MLRLNLSSKPSWHDLGHGVRLKMFPPTTAIMMAARKDPGVVAIGTADEVDEVAAGLVVAKFVARAVIDEWEGVGGDDGNLLPVTPDAVDALMDMWPIFEAFQEKYMAVGLMLELEKNVSSPSLNGNTAAAMDTAKPVQKSAKTARRKKINRKPAKVGRSGTCRNA